MPASNTVTLPWLVLDLTHRCLRCSRCSTERRLPDEIMMGEAALSLTGLSNQMVEFATRHMHAPSVVEAGAAA